MARITRFVVVLIIVYAALIPLIVHNEAPIEDRLLVRSIDFGGDDAELLKKFAAAEAPYDCPQTKAMVMLVALNRAWHPDFPNSIEGAIVNGGFESVLDGSFYAAVPDEDCEVALNMIYQGWNRSENALYISKRPGRYELGDGCTYITQCDDIKFYK